MKNYNKIDFIQKALRASVCLLLLSGTTVLYAQEDYSAEEAENVPVVRKEKKKIALPKYEMVEVSGIIYDAATNKPLSGVRIQALNNKAYTAMTDEDGSYKISVPKFVTSLFISSPDFSNTQMPIKGFTGQNCKIYSDKFSSIFTDGTNLVSASKRSILNSSEVTLEGELENHLAAEVHTINRGGIPGQGAAMFINGVNSLNAVAQPLVIVDGVIIDMQYDRTTIHNGFFNNILNAIDIEDIATVEVLKNGTALYGAKASNGVILITTKRCNSMATRINVRLYGGFETSPSQTKMMDGGQYRNYASSLIGTTKIGQDMASTTSIPWLNEDPTYTYYKMYHNNTDWQKELYETAFTQNYKVNVDGGDEVAMYHLALGYTKADATAKNNGYDRLNVRFNTDINLLDKLSTSLDISYGRSTYSLHDNGWASDYSTSNIASPNVLGLIQSPMLSEKAYVTVWDDVTQSNKLMTSDKVLAGKNYDDLMNPFRFGESFGTAALVNPYWTLLNGEGSNKNYQEQTLFSVNAQPKYQISKSLWITNRFSYQLNRTSEKYYLPINGTPKKAVEGLGTVTSAVKSQFSKETTVFNDFRLNFEKQMGAHYLNVFGGFRMSSFMYSNSYLRAYNNQNDKMPNFSYDLQYRSYGGSNDKWLSLSYYLNGEYNYKNRYFAQVTTTMESSSRFGKNCEEGVKLFGVKWGLFPSIQGAWLISSEPWFRAKAVNYLKLTAGYEETGNDNVDYYASRTYFENVKFMDKATALQLANIQNSKIQWETTRRFNVGLQGSFFNNRINLGVDLFYAKTSNLLVKEEAGTLAGLAYIWTNSGELENKGFQVNANGVILNNKNWKLQAGVSVGHYINEITKLPTENVINNYSLTKNGTNDQLLSTINGYSSSIYGENNILTAVGSSAGVFYGYKTAGVFSTNEQAANAGKYGYLRYPTGIVGNPYREFKAGDVQFVDVNGDGWISASDMVEIGDPNPSVYGNMFATLSYKRWTIDLNFKYSLGNDVYNYQRSQLEQSNNLWNQTTAVVNRWTYEGQQTDMPRVMAVSSDSWVNNERFSDRWIEDGSYLKLKKVRLTYKLPVALSWLQGLTVWGEANNVFTITKYLGNDPEVSCGNSVLYQGIDAGYLMQNRNFNLGVTINL
ncbi:MAG: SusC/RagA family TonB-linked outer membrane protein [Bacteroidaceae bacterium]